MEASGLHKSRLYDVAVITGEPGAKPLANAQTLNPRILNPEPTALEPWIPKRLLYRYRSLKGALQSTPEKRIHAHTLDNPKP